MVSPIITAVLISAGAAAYLGHFDARLGFALLVFLLSVGVLVPQFIHLISRKPGESVVEYRARLHTLLVENIQGMADLWMFGRAAERRKQIARVGRDYQSAQRKMARITTFFSGRFWERYAPNRRGGRHRRRSRQ